MSFSGQSNPPWQRNSMNNSMQGIGFHQNSQMFLNQQSSQQNQNMQYNQMGSGNVNQMSNNQVFQQQGVAYPSRTGLNPVAFQNTNSGSGQNQQNQNRQYNSMGTVTKISNDCGLVNDEVLFYKNICKGVVPKVGDRVRFESSYSTTSQFKWNATRVQLVSQAAAQANQAPPPPLMGQCVNKSSSGYNAVPPPVEYRALAASQRRGSPGGARRGSPGNDRHSNRDRKDSNRGRDRTERSELEGDRKRRRDESPRPRDRDRREQEKRDISLDKKDRDRSPVRRLSPKRRKTRPIPRYVVQIPKTLLTFKSGGVQEIKRRYSNLYIPSDFFHTEVKWSETFTPDNPFSMRRPCSFHIAHKIVEPLNEVKAANEPEDADYIFSAKVMLMGCPPLSELYQRCFNQDEHEDTHNCVHPSRLINFLVGTRARNEPMAIGGPWSPSLDGENPDKDPAVLIRTAIRTCKTLTGIDLSNCTQWYRFVELYYHRADYTSKGKAIPSRVETVVIYLPDIHSCMPTRSEWETLAADYKTAATNHLNRLKSAAQQSTSAGASSEDGKSTKDANEAANVPDSATSLANLGGEAGDNQQDENGTEKEDNKKEPTHYSKLDLKTMKIQEIRDELIARNLSHKGLKPQVSARLAKVLLTEKEKEKSDSEKDDEDSKKADDRADDANMKDDDADTKDDDADAGIEVDMTDIVILDEYDSSKNQDGENQEKDQNKELDEKDRKQLQRRYVLPEEPHVIVHPSRTAKDGKFDCTVMSLSVLLDYRPEDTKERFFEVSLFAELFNEMLMRDFGFNIFKELHFYKEPVVEKEEPKKDENKTNDEDEKSKDSSNQDQSSEKKSLGENEKKDKNARDRRVSKRPADDDTEDESYSVHSIERKRKSDRKMCVAKPHLLLSFIYFDTSHCGYIFEKDLEELFSILGLSLSRAEIRKSLSKTLSRHAFYYRKLTDAEEKPENTVKDIDAGDDFPMEELKRIASGNNCLLPVFKASEDTEQKSATGGEGCAADNDGMVTHNGVLVHVGKLFEQNKRYEKSYSELEQMYIDIKKQHAELQTSNSKANNKTKDLQSEVKSLLRKLSDADQDLFTLNRKYSDQHSALMYCYDKIAPFVPRSDKNHKSSDGSRDRDGTKEKKDEKEKEKKEDKDKKEEKDKKEDKENEKKDEKEKPDDKVDKEKQASEKVEVEKGLKAELKKETE